jgi:hypothetical protein
VEVAIGIDTHKSSLAVAAVDPLGRVLDAGEFSNDRGGMTCSSSGRGNAGRKGDRDRVFDQLWSHAVKASPSVRGGCVGARVARFRPGDEVFGQSLVTNLWRHGGAFAEYAAVPEARFELKPAGLTFEQAAAVPTSGSLACKVFATRAGSRRHRRP